MQTKKEKQANAIKSLQDKLNSGKKVVKVNGKTTNEFTNLTDADKAKIKDDINHLKELIAKPRIDPKKHDRFSRRKKH